MIKDELIKVVCILILVSVSLSAINLKESNQKVLESSPTSNPSINNDNLLELRILLGEEKKETPPERIIEQVIPDEKEFNYSQHMQSFLEAPSDYYTINIATTIGLDAANTYVINNSLSNTSTYSFGPKMESAKVIYGIFESVKEAKEAMDELPTLVKENKPYVDNILKHQNLYLKYNK